MTPLFNPTRLDLARRRRGWSKQGLAEAVGVSPRMLTAYERGDAVPRDTTLNRLASALHFPPSFFEGPDLEEPPVAASSFRALSRLTARTRDQALGAGAMALALSDWIEARFQLPEADVPRYERINAETAAIAVRSEWGLGARSVPHMIHLLEAHGVRVFSLVEETHDLDAFSFWRGGTPYVFLNTAKSGERSRMDAAHELGHLVLHWEGGVRGREVEREAHGFGSAFLMPQESVIAEAPRGGTLAQIASAKRNWKVSIANLTYRMHSVGMLSDWQYHTLFRQISSLGYRKNEPDGIPGETSRLLEKVFAALGREGVTMRRVAEDLGIFAEELHRHVFRLVLTPV